MKKHAPNELHATRTVYIAAILINNKTWHLWFSEFLPSSSAWCRERRNYLLFCILNSNKFVSTKTLPFFFFFVSFFWTSVVMTCIFRRHVNSTWRKYFISKLKTATRFSSAFFEHRLHVNSIWYDSSWKSSSSSSMPLKKCFLFPQNWLSCASNGI